jgi:hypothetical protein
MSTNGDRFRRCVEELTPNCTPDDHTIKPLSNIELLELYYAVDIRVKIAREVAMPDPNLHHLVVLCNLCDAPLAAENTSCTLNVYAFAVGRFAAAHQPGYGLTTMRRAAWL